MSPFLNSIEQLRRVEWSRSNLWDIRFLDNKDIPVPFDEWFPAESIEEPIGLINTQQFPLYMTTIEIPIGTGLSDMRITFLDDVDNSLLEWLRDWMNESMLNNGEYVSTLSEIVKKVQIIKLDKKKNEIGNTTYYVFPKNIVTYNGNSQADTNKYTVNFAVVGKLEGSGG